MSETDHFDRLAEARYRKILESQPQFVWRQFTDGEQLRVRVFFPEGHSRNSSSAAVLFFHGGMWQAPNLVEFVPWALHLSRYGIVSILPEYRTRQSYDVTTENVMEDAQEAWLWIHDNAEELGIDLEKISLAGSDVGGLMALHAGMSSRKVTRRWFKKVVEEDPKPAAIVLFRGVTDFHHSSAIKLFSDAETDFVERMNPSKRLRKGLPALFAAHGDKDKLLPWKMGDSLIRQWKKYKNKALFFRVEQADHAFHHFNVNAAYFECVLNEWIRFMSEQGIWEFDDLEERLLLN